MAILADTTVLVAASHRKHDEHAACLRWLKATVARTEVVASAHALAEAYNTFTRTTGMFRMTPEDAARITNRFSTRLKIVGLDARDYEDAIAWAKDRGVVGETVYDALHAFAAQKAGAARLATLNTKHFALVWPARQLIHPPSL